MFIADSDLILNPIEWKMNTKNEIKKSYVRRFQFEIGNKENWNSDCQQSKIKIAHEPQMNQMKIKCAYLKIKRWEEKFAYCRS